MLYLLCFSSQIFFRSVAIQIKVLILIPEIIWTCLDGNDYLKAVQIYLFAIHIQTGMLNIIFNMCFNESQAWFLLFMAILRNA